MFDTDEIFEEVLVYCRELLGNKTLILVLFIRPFNNSNKLHNKKYVDSYMPDFVT
jgi:hypothetical protein